MMMGVAATTCGGADACVHTGSCVHGYLQSVSFMRGGGGGAGWAVLAGLSALVISGAVESMVGEGKGRG